MAMLVTMGSIMSVVFLLMLVRVAFVVMSWCGDDFGYGGHDDDGYLDVCGRCDGGNRDGNVGFYNNIGEETQVDV